MAGVVLLGGSGNLPDTGAVLGTDIGNFIRIGISSACDIKGYVRIVPAVPFHVILVH